MALANLIDPPVRQFRQPASKKPVSLATVDALSGTILEPLVPRGLPAPPETQHQKVFRLVRERKFEEAARIAAKLIDVGNVVGFLDYHGTERFDAALSWLARNVSHGDVEAHAPFYDLSPEIAQILVQNNQDNRPISPGGLAKRMRDIADGRWKVNGENVIISTEGKMNDGQHRCWAVILTGRAIKTLFTFGIERSTRDTVDGGIKRQAGGQALMNGVKAGKQKMAIVSEFYRLTEGREATDAEKHDFYYPNADAVDFAHSITNNRMPALHARSPIAAGLYYLASRGVSRSSLDGFMAVVRSKLGHKARCPAFILRDDMLSGKTKRSSRDWSLATIQHFLLWRAGKKVGKVEVPAHIPLVTR